MAAEWTVVVEPHGVSESAETGGVLVVLTDGEVRHEMVRVAFTRRVSENPEVSFEEKLNEELVKAENCCEIINDLLDDFDRMQAEKVMVARDRIAEVLGAPLSLHKMPT